LEERRYVERDPDTGTYRLGLAFLPMHAQRLDVFMRHIRPYLERLRDQFGETANLGLLDRNAILYLDIVESPHAMRLAAKPGQRDRLHSTALGKAIAAHLSAERVREILKKEGMPQLTDSTITSQRKYLAAIADIRETGYALDDEENEVGARCVAVALPLGEPLLAISVSGPSARIRPDAVPAIATQLMKSAEQIASELNSVRELRP
jgi:IclR family acetate operon transcriptional repressor